MTTAPSAPSTGKVSVYVDSNGDLAWKDASGNITTIAAASSFTLTLTSGSWTPSLQFAGVTTGITYTSRVGTYTRIGDICFIQGAFLLSSKGAAAGNAAVAGLPFTVRNTAGLYGPLSIQWLGMTSTLVSALGVFLINTTTFAVNGATAATAGIVSVTDTAFANTSELRFSGFYFV